MFVTLTDTTILNKTFDSFLHGLKIETRLAQLQ